MYQGPKSIEGFLPQRVVYEWIAKFKKMFAQVLGLKEAVREWLAAQPKTFFSEACTKMEEVH